MSRSLVVSACFLVVALVLGGLGVYAHENTATRHVCPEGYGPVTRGDFATACFRPAVESDFTPLRDPRDAVRGGKDYSEALAEMLANDPTLKGADFTAPRQETVNGRPSALDPDAAGLWWYSAASTLALSVLLGAVYAAATRRRGTTEGV